MSAEKFKAIIERADFREILEGFLNTEHPDVNETCKTLTRIISGAAEKSCKRRKTRSSQSNKIPKYNHDI